MTWLLDPDTGDVYDESSIFVGTATGPPYTLPDDIVDVVVSNLLPAPTASVNGEHLEIVISIHPGNVEFGVP